MIRGMSLRSRCRHPTASSLTGSLIDRVLPLRCPACGGAAVDCGACLASALRPEPALAAATGASACWSMADYAVARPVVLGIKRRGMVALGSVVGAGLGEAWMAAPTEGGGRRRVPSLVSWVPTAAGRARARGFDHAEVLAAAAAERIGVPAVPLLERLPARSADGRWPADGAQHGKPRAERLRGPRFAPSRAAIRLVEQRLADLHAAGPVILIDDVATTGATLRAAVRALGSAGLGPMVGLVVAVSPDLAALRSGRAARGG
jgi:predicted amidophosphoribosyltransferase